MSKKPTTNESRINAGPLFISPLLRRGAGGEASHTSSPSCQIEISRHSWTPPHSFRFTKSTPFNICFFNSRAAGVQPMRENSLLWIGSRACSHKNGIFDWVVVFVSFNIKRKKEFYVMIKLQSKL
jgi:hypothetical protein